MGATISQPVQPEPTTSQPIQPEPATSHFSFLELPPEIRVMVYEELVVVGKVFYSPDTYDLWNGKRCRGYHLYRKPDVSLLRVCKQIHAEAEPVYLSKNLFVLPVKWTDYNPFKELTCFRVRDLNSDARHLFSEAGLSHVKNISIAIDQKLTDKPGKWMFRDWWRDEDRFGHTPFSQLSRVERFERVHASTTEAVQEGWIRMLDFLSKFKEGINYLETDFTNAFCPFGECRPITDAVFHGWILNTRPSTLDVIGLQTREEREDFVDRATEDGEISYEELKNEYGLRFRTVWESTPWDKWMMN